VLLGWLDSGLRLNSERLIHSCLSSGFLAVGVVAMVVMMMAVVVMMTVVVLMGLEVLLSCLIAGPETLIKANLEYLLIFLAEFVVVVMTMMAVVMMTVVVVAVAFYLLISVTFSTRCITFVFMLVLLFVGLGLIGSARRSGYRDARSTTGSRFRGTNSSSHILVTLTLALGLGLIGSARRSGYRKARSAAGSRINGASSTSYNITRGKGTGTIPLGCCTPDNMVKSGKSVSRDSAEGNSSDDYRSLGSDHFTIRLEKGIKCERFKQVDVAVGRLFGNQHRRGNELCEC
jgi:hypothetical protein